VEKLHGPSSNEALTCRTYLALGYMQHRQFERAEQVMAPSLTALQRSRPSEVSILLGLLNNLGAIALQRKEYAKARQYFDLAFSRYAADRSPLDYTLLLIGYNSAMTHQFAGEFDQAEPRLRAAIEGMRSGGHTQNNGYRSALMSYSHTLLRLQKWADAAVIAAECLAIYRKTDPDSNYVYRAMSTLGAAKVGLKQFAEAEPLLVEGYEGIVRSRTDRRMGNPDEQIRIAQTRLMELYEAWGKPEEAAQWRAKIRRKLEVAPQPRSK
ncbi:MAG: tetratricopeptide repeat protein, partial [Gemmataceae bacterium]